MMNTTNTTDLHTDTAAHLHEHADAPTMPIAPIAPVDQEPEADGHAARSPKAAGSQGVTFATLGLIGPLLEALEEEGYTVPTPIQAAAIPPGLAGKDILGSAQTGTGKTAAFALPILQRLALATPDKSYRGPVYPRALILSPTRELATQIAESFATYGRYTTLRHTTVYGGVSQFHQVKALRNGVDILVATPGRLIDLMNQRLVNLSKVEVFVLDEADRMLDMGFIEPIRHIASSIPARELVNRQTLLFSATMPREIMHLADSLLHNPVKVSVSPVSSAAPLIEQSLYVVPKERKGLLLQHLLQEGNVQRAVVFARTKFGAERLGNRLNDAGITAESIHGDKAQNARKKALSRFKEGLSRVLVATDVAARGLDVDGITHVFNFDLPFEPEAYVHRIGRTGRAGAKGTAIAFCDPGEHGLLRAIERLTKSTIPKVAKLPDLRPLIHAEMDRLDTRPGRPAGTAAPAHAPQHYAAPGQHTAQQRSDGPAPRAGGFAPPRENGFHAPRRAPHGEHAESAHPRAPRRDTPASSHPRPRVRRDDVDGGNPWGGPPRSGPARSGPAGFGPAKSRPQRDDSHQSNDSRRAEGRGGYGPRSYGPGPGRTGANNADAGRNDAGRAGPRGGGQSYAGGGGDHARGGQPGAPRGGRPASSKGSFGKPSFGKSFGNAGKGKSGGGRSSGPRRGFGGR